MALPYLCRLHQVLVRMAWGIPALKQNDAERGVGS
jgi:hypothetical protein